jgi:molybdopterin-containing oxidoreductase family iron-sulfur binding subunit
VNRVSRRDFLKILSASGLSLTLGSCGKEETRYLYSELVQPEEMIPGVPRWFPSVCRECPAGCGLLVKNREGRSIKLEGNPSHPVNRGSLCARGQAALQELYHPDRLRGPFRRSEDGGVENISWQEGIGEITDRIRESIETRGADSVAYLGPLEGDSFSGLIEEWFRLLGSDRLYIGEAFDFAPMLEANEISFGLRDIPEYEFSNARLLLSFGADFLESWLSPVAFGRAFAETRRSSDGGKRRFIYFGPRMNLTASNADRYIAVQPGQEITIVLGLIRLILEQSRGIDLPSSEIGDLRELVEPFTPGDIHSRTGIDPGTLKDIAREFKREPSLAIGGGVDITHSRSTLSNIAIDLLNYVSGNFGKTVTFGRPSSYRAITPYRALLDLVEAMKGGEVSVLFVHRIDPHSILPSSAGWEEALETVPMVLSLSPCLDRITSQADYVLPVSTPLESWGDYSPREGVRGLIQPSTAPIFDTAMAGDIFLRLARRLGIPVRGGENEDFGGYVKKTWRHAYGPFGSDDEFDRFWEESLRDGGRWDDPPPEDRAVALRPEVFSLDWREPDSVLNGDPVIVHFASLAHYDGRGTNRPWLRELPDPISKIAWDPWMEIHPETAGQLGITDRERVEIRTGSGRTTLTARVTEDMARSILAVPVGLYSDTPEGVGAMTAVEEIPEKLSGGRIWTGTRVRVTGTGAPGISPQVQSGFIDYGRGIAGTMTREESALPGGEENARGDVTGNRRPQMYKAHDHPEHRWGMTIDLSLCTGCSACVVACYAENNIPVVGRESILNGREMSWIRIERYDVIVGGNKEVIHLPMLCQHCDSAPCEPVCPVFATYHNPEGLNAQVYNRCIGTRYCSNNCPYKVRRFNWFTRLWPGSLDLQLNPDVTVREKGVTEKCSFCVQRIRFAKDRAKDENRNIRDGEIVPACAQTCPTGAIVFGDMNDPESRVSRLARDPRAYRVLAHLNTRPAVTYLKRID